MYKRFIIIERTWQMVFDWRGNRYRALLTSSFVPEKRGNRETEIPVDLGRYRESADEISIQNTNREDCSLESFTHKSWPK